MKAFSALVLIAMSSVLAHAGQTIKCVSLATEFQYLIEVQKGILSEFDETGRLIGRQANLNPVFKYRETYPATTIIEMQNSLGNVEISISRMGNSMVGEIDDDENLKCNFVD